LVTCGISPQDQIACGDIGVADLGVLAHLRLAAELAAPFLDGTLLFIRYPLPHACRQRCAGGGDEDKAVQERVVDGTLQSVTLVRSGRRGRIECRPAIARCQEMHGQRTSSTWTGTGPAADDDGRAR